MSMPSENKLNPPISRCAITSRSRSGHRLKRKLMMEPLESRKVLSVNWADTFGGVGADDTRDLEIGPDGSIYVSGLFRDGTTIDFDDQDTTGEVTSQATGNKRSVGSDGFLVKYDQEGNFQWVVHAANDKSAQVSGVAVDSQGNAYIVGVFQEYIDFYSNDTMQVTLRSSVSRAGEDVFIAKVSASGDFEWAEVLGGRGNQRASNIELLEDASTGDIGLFIRGQAFGGGDLDPGPLETLQNAGSGDIHGFLARYHHDVSSGLQLDWFSSRETGLQSGWLFELDVTDSQVVGVGQIDADTGFVGVFDASTGELIEENLMPSAAGHGGIDRLGNDLIVSGNFVGDVDLDGDGTADLRGDSTRHGFLARYSFDESRPAGERLSVAWAWEQQVDENGWYDLLDVKVSSIGEVHAIGQFTGGLSLDGIQLQSIANSYDGLFLTLDSLSGTAVSATGFGGSGVEYPRLLQVSGAGTVVGIGRTTSSDAAFPNLTETFATAGDTDGFVTAFTPVTSASPTADAGAILNGDEGQELTFDASSSFDPDGDQLTYRWDFGDGAKVETTASTVSYAYSYGGDFEVALTVLDGNGNFGTDTTTARVVEVNNAPVADIGGPYGGFVTTPIAFDASASSDFDNVDGTDINDQTLTYHWDFGDGVTSTTATANAEHIFEEVGSYHVVLTIFDGHVISSPSVTTVDVYEAPPSDPNTIYVWDIQDDLLSRQRGKFNDYRIAVEVRRDSDGDGLAEATDAAVSDVWVALQLRNQSGQLVRTLSGRTDETGTFETEWIKDLEAGSYQVSVSELAASGYLWDPLDVLDATANDDGDDEDGNPFESYTIG